MCNEMAQEKAWKEYVELMARENLGIVDPANEPKLPFGSVKPSDPAAVIRATPGGSKLEVLRWGWPPHAGKGLVINVRSETRKDPQAARGLVIFDRFYEFGDTKPPKPKFEFSPQTNQPLAFGVIVRQDRFSLITTEPGPEVGAVHNRQPVIVRTDDWRRWLTDPAWPKDLASPSPAGTLKSHQVR